jgi:AraC-like DNA-binding protein
LAEVKLLREPSPHRLIIETMIERIHANSADDWSVPRLAAESGLSESVLRREFRKATGRSPARFVREARLGVAAQLIQQGIYTLATIAEQLNFSSPFHLSTAFKNHFGVSPSELRKEEGP